MELWSRTLESMGMKTSFWRGRRVFLTGHTGFKGAWLSLWLADLGAEVTGYALDPLTDPNLFSLANVGTCISDRRGDIRDRENLATAIFNAQPEIVFHLAAQPLVRESYRSPIETFETNILGTAYVLEAIRAISSVRSAVIVTTDKCYENTEKQEGYRETDPLGGYDPYSGSKAAAEIVTGVYRSSYFKSDRFEHHGVGIATARAGNVIGGGDWSPERLVPDFVRSLVLGQPLILRNLKSVRPWQHVLEPLKGYLLLAEHLYYDGSRYSGPWNFGPSDQDHLTVERLIAMLQSELGASVPLKTPRQPQPHETQILRLDSTKAKGQLGWKPVFDAQQSIQWTAKWLRQYLAHEDMAAATRRQILEYEQINIP